ncbi:unnamed protein product [Medioppia subpectinata]|uniref:Uncharacterized protein n=1 Tax=Medioppia subpectinata TaxID=1979941 RepID=A0A7R9L6A2_9ACAR|nr:unnamed protein product [Medioppia subpectinata]CAG2115202.1 unnamed protein product [Medioppia subpectinata]
MPNPAILSSQLTSLSEESDRKCRELCEEMSALKASNESEVKALEAQLNTSNDSMAEEINDLKQSNQQMVTDLSEVLALKAQLKTSNDSMDTQIKDLRQKFCHKEVIKDWFTALFIICLVSGVHIVSTKVSALSEELSTLKQKVSSNMSDPEMVPPFSELWAKNSCLTQELFPLNASNGYEVKAQLKSAMDSMQTMEKEISELREMFLISDNRGSMSDLSSSSSSIGSHNEMTTNSDETRDEINIRDMFKKIENKIKDQCQLIYTLLEALVIENKLSLTALEDIRQLAEDSDDSESIVVVDSHHE